MASEIGVSYPKKITKLQIPRTLPAGGEDYFNRRLAERLEYSPETRANFKKYQEFFRKNDPSLEIDFTPIAGHISPISRCNFKCTMCAVTDFKNGKRCEDMSLELFKRRLNDLPGLVQISLVGLSEIFLLHKTLEPMMRLCLERKIWTNIATNGSLLHQRNWIERLVDINLDEIVISIDGVSKKTFEAIRIKSDFKTVISNALRLNEVFDKSSIVPSRTKMQTVLQKSNLHELFEFIPLARELGFKTIAFETEAFDWGSSLWRDTNSQVTRTISQEDIAVLVDQGVKYGVTVGFVEITQRYTTEPKISSLCNWPFSKIFISSDDRVVPCCHISNPDHFEIGNGLTDAISATDSWFGESYKSFRASHATGNIPDACSSCYKSKQ